MTISREQAAWAAADFAWVALQNEPEASRRYCFMLGYVTASLESDY